MKVNLITQRYYPNNIQFGNQPRVRDNLSRTTYPDIGEAIREINHDYDVKSDYLSELSSEINLSPMSHKTQQYKLQLKRDMMIAQLVGEDYNDEAGDDFLERLTY
jgi:hypothetical protein